MISERHQFRILMLGAVVLSVATFAFLHAYASTGILPPPPGDALIQFQYARALAEGHAYRFNPDDLPSTGAGGHLYPALLAVAYAAGLEGMSLAVAGFLLNALLLLGSCVLVWVTSRRLDPESAWFSLALTVFSGQLLFLTFNQGGTALVLFLAVAAFSSAAYQRPLLLTPLLVALSIASPTGGLFSLGLLVTAMTPILRGCRPQGAWIIAGGSGLAAAGIIAVWNVYLTGFMRPTSLVGLDLLASATILQAVNALAMNGANLFVELLLGRGESSRSMYFVPFFGGALTFYGLLNSGITRSGQPSVEAWWCMTGLLMILATSLLGTSGAEHDRDLAVFAPVFFIYAALGLRRLLGLTSQTRAFPAAAGLLLAVHMLGAVYFGAQLARESAIASSNASFVDKVRRGLPGSSRIGDADSPGRLYRLRNHSLHDVHGAVTPEFLTPSSRVTNIERMRNDPAVQFDYWLFPATKFRGQWYSGLAGSQLDMEPPVFGAHRALALHRADWSSLEASTEPATPEILAFVNTLEAVDRIDVGFSPDERRSGYTVSGIGPDTKLLPISQTQRLGDRTVTDVGRLVPAYETMEVSVQPEKSLIVILRTSALAPIMTATGVRHELLESPLTLGVSINGKPAGEYDLPLNSPGSFTEVGLRIPAEFVTADPMELRITGAHATYGLWFYQ